MVPTRNRSGQGPLRRLPYRSCDCVDVQASLKVWDTATCVAGKSPRSPGLPRSPHSRAKDIRIGKNSINTDPLSSRPLLL